MKGTYSFSLERQRTAASEMGGQLLWVATDPRLVVRWVWDQFYVNERADTTVKVKNKKQTCYLRTFVSSDKQWKTQIFTWKSREGNASERVA